jgi:hypothetical protein
MAMIVGHLTSTVVVLITESMIEEASLTGIFISVHYISWKENVDLLSKSGQNLRNFSTGELYCSVPSVGSAHIASMYSFRGLSIECRWEDSSQDKKISYHRESAKDQKAYKQGSWDRTVSSKSRHSSKRKDNEVTH